MWPFSSHKEYRVTPDRDEWAAPEETLIDSSSDLSTVEVPVSDTIFRVSYILTALFSLVLIGSAGWLSVVRYGYFSQISWRNKTVNVSVPPPRGVIMDRNGLPLVQNVPSFDLLVISRQVHRAADDTFPDIGVLAAVLGRDPEDLTLFLNDGINHNAVFFLATDVTRDQVLSLKNILPPGFYLITSTKRAYRDGPEFSHILGYVGKVATSDMAKDPYYLPSDTIGRLGVEASYEDTLRGTHGQLVFAGSNKTATVLPAAYGGNVALNIDADAQRELFGAVFGILRASGLSQAAAVAQDPQTGAVIAMVSFPTYDNNVFSGQLTQAEADQLFNSNQRPLFNRVISGLYNPGSTIKPLMGMSGLQEGVMRPDQTVVDNCVKLTVPNPNDPTHPYIFDNWRPDTGPFDLNRAIANSCNIYFFTVGGGSPPGQFPAFSGLGVQRIVDYLRKGLADSNLGIDLSGEEHGFVPTPDWKYQTKKEPWYQGDTYNISIGQGDLLVTPLWLNTYLSAIANGGTLYKPMVASRVVDDQKNTLTTFPPTVIGHLPYSPAVIAQMQKAMRGTVTVGTAGILRDLPVSAAAKTGTAEVIKGQRINSLLTVYAPADNPRIAVTVLIEGSASNQGYALRATNQFLKWYFGAPSPSPAASSSAAFEVP